jgi:hypothetical protein
MRGSLLLPSLLLWSAAGCGAGDLTLPGPGEPASLTIVGGNGQQGAPGEVVPEPLIVELVDGVGQPVSGRVVAFQFLDAVDGAAVDPGTGATDAAGRVSVRARLGQETGAQPLEASVATPGEDLRVRFDLRAKAPDPGGGEGEASRRPRRRRTMAQGRSVGVMGATGVVLEGAVGVGAVARVGEGKGAMGVVTEATVTIRTRAKAAARARIEGSAVSFAGAGS